MKPKNDALQPPSCAASLAGGESFAGHNAPKMMPVNSTVNLSPQRARETDGSRSSQDEAGEDCASSNSPNGGPRVRKSSQLAAILTRTPSRCSDKSANGYGTNCVDSPNFNLPENRHPPVKKASINIISNPNFELAPSKPSHPFGFSAPNPTHHEQTSIKQSKRTMESNDEKVGKHEKKRHRTSFSSSLRRLLTITFNRSNNSTSTPSNPKDTTTTNSISTAGPSNNHTISKGKPDTRQIDKTSLYNKNSAGTNRKRKHFTLTANAVPTSQALAPRSSLSSAKSYNAKQATNFDKKTKRDLGKRLSLTQLTTMATVDLDDEDSPHHQTDGGKVSGGQISQRLSERSSIGSINGGLTEIDGRTFIECPVCVLPVSESSTPYLAVCGHRVCLDCMQRYITTEINHSRLNITCPICSEPIHPNTIRNILQNEKYYLKYECFMLRRVLAAEPDARWCPAPDCSYVVLANGCASCPKLVCGREGCDTAFCYHCKQEWHPNQTCSAASIQRNKPAINTYNIGDLIEETSIFPTTTSNSKSSKASQQTSHIRAEDIKECPVCSSRIIKMNDGSCNHMTCSICETEFCWLCMKEISDLHYFSPSGCTFWGKKPWSRKKKLLWQLGMLVGAPICIILIAGIAVPAIVIGIPVWAARKLHNRLERTPFSRYKKNAIITGGVLLSFVVSPIVSAVALAVGIPILLGYVYGVVPLSLCRSSGGCLSSNPSLENLQQQFQSSRNAGRQGTSDVISIDTALSHKMGDPSIGETSLYMSNISLETNSIGHVTIVEREDRESASNAALAGSIMSNVQDDENSTRALAGSIMSKESGYTLVPAEIHTSNQASAVTSNSKSDSVQQPVERKSQINSTADRRTMAMSG